MHDLPSSHVVVLGAGYAGVLAALRIAGRAPRGTRVTLASASPWFVERIRNHETAAGSPSRRHPLERLVRGTGIEVVVGTAVEIDPRGQRLRFDDGRQLAWDRLVYAVGSFGDRDAVPGAREHAFSVEREDDAMRLASAIASAADGARVLVVGGGHTAVETATELAERHPRLAVAMLASGPIAPALSTDGRAHVRGALDALRIATIEGARAVAVDERSVVLDDGREERADIVVWCGGFAVSSLARDAGLPTDARGRLLVHPTLRAVGHENVYACGDAAAIAARLPYPIRMACATAMPMAAHAADQVVADLTGREPRIFGFAYFVQCLSLGRERGFVFRVARDDSPSGLSFAGKKGARLKEAVCRYTTISLAIERILPGTYTWPSRGRPLLDAPPYPVLPERTS